MMTFALKMMSFAFKMMDSATIKVLGGLADHNVRFYLEMKILQ